jgi:hypothetical protein
MLEGFSPSYMVSEHSQKYKETSSLVIWMTFHAIQGEKSSHITPTKVNQNAECSDQMTLERTFTGMQ